MAAIWYVRLSFLRGTGTIANNVSQDILFLKSGIVGGGGDVRLLAD